MLECQLTKCLTTMSRWYKYIIPVDKKRHVIVSPGVHTLVKEYARNQDITMTEALYRLLKAGFRHEGVDLDEK